MNAQIIPLVRMPRRFAFFDYKIPERLEVHIGDLVLAPLKGRMVAGIVRGISETSEFSKLQTVETILQSKYMTPGDIKRLERIADQIIQSNSTMFTSALQGITHSRSTEQQTHKAHSGSIDKQSAVAIRSAIDSEALDNSIEASLEDCIALIHLSIKSAKNQTLVICPRERDVEIISRFLPMPHARLHGHTPIAKRKHILTQWRSGKIKALIGTRQASLIPANSIDTIIIVDPNSDDHVSYSRNPRYDARLATQLLTNQHNAKLITCGPISKIEAKQITTFLTPTISPKIIDLSDKREYSGSPLISESLLSAMSDSLQNGQSVLISYNCKGVAKRLTCKSCHHTPMCGTCGSQPNVRLDDLVCPVCKTEMWIPKACPLCRKKTLTSRGIGNKRIVAELKKHFPAASIEIIDKEHSKKSDAQIQIVTEYYFQSIYSPFPAKRFGLVAELMAEKSLGSDYKSSAVTAHRLHRLVHLASYHKAKCIVQTWMTDTIKPMLNSEKYTKSESTLRKKYGLPPFANQYEFSGKIEELPEEIKSECIELDEKLTLTVSHDNKEEIIKKLKKLPDGVTILTTYSSY